MAKRGCPKTMKLKSIAWGALFRLFFQGSLSVVIFAAVLICQSCLYKSAEKRMRTVGTGFQFRMGLCCDEPGMFRNLYHLYDPSVRGEAGELHAMTGEILPVVVVDFIAVPVPLFYFFTLIKSVCLGSFIQDTGDMRRGGEFLQYLPHLPGQA